MSRITAILRGIWEFVVGDDWVTAAGVVIALAITALVAEGSAGWWVMPPAVAALLALSLARARPRR